MTSLRYIEVDGPTRDAPVELRERIARVMADLRKDENATAPRRTRGGSWTEEYKGPRTINAKMRAIPEAEYEKAPYAYLDTSLHIHYGWGAKAQRPQVWKGSDREMGLLTEVIGQNVVGALSKAGVVTSWDGSAMSAIIVLGYLVADTTEQEG